VVLAVTPIRSPEVSLNLFREDINFSDSVPDMDLADLFLNERSDDALIYSLDLSTIETAQQADRALLRKVRTGVPGFRLKTFRGGGKVICQRDLIYIPKALQARVTEWYHLMLCHSGATRTEATIRQHLTWPGLRNHVLACVQTCDICQRYKKNVIANIYH
jgi:hypothetical protein